MKKNFMKLLTCLTAVVAVAAVSMPVEAAGVKPVEKIGFEEAGEMQIAGGAISKDAERGSVLVLDGGAKGSSYATKDSELFAETDWTDGMTIAFWVKPANSDPGIAPLYSFNIADNGCEGYIATTDSLEIAINSDGNSGMAEYPRVWADPVVVDASAQPVLEAGKWQHVAVTLSASGMVIYLNGEVYSEPVLGPSSANFKMFLSQIPYCYGLQLGNWNCGWWEEIGSFAGSYDDVYVFNKALNQTEVKETMNAEFNSMGSAGIGMPVIIAIVAAVVVLAVAVVAVIVVRKKNKKDQVVNK